MFYMFEGVNGLGVSMNGRDWVFMIVDDVGNFSRFLLLIGVDVDCKGLCRGFKHDECMRSVPAPPYLFWEESSALKAWVATEAPHGKYAAVVIPVRWERM